MEEEILQTMDGFKLDHSLAFNLFLLIAASENCEIRPRPYHRRKATGRGLASEKLNNGKNPEA